MTWTKLDDRLVSNRKYRKAGTAARLLYIEGLVWCNGELTDGFIESDAVGYFAPWALSDIDTLSAELVGLGLWTVVDGGWQVSNFLDWNPSREKVEEDRERRREAEARRRDRARVAARGGHVEGTFPASAASRPDPSRPENQSRPRVPDFVPDTSPKPDPVDNVTNLRRARGTA